VGRASGCKNCFQFITGDQMNLPVATNELISELDAGLVTETPSGRNFSVTYGMKHPKTATLLEMLEANSTDQEVCIWLQSAKIGDQTSYAQGSITVRRIE
jgi:hypothetical protein